MEPLLVCLPQRPVLSRTRDAAALSTVLLEWGDLLLRPGALLDAGAPEDISTLLTRLPAVLPCQSAALWICNRASADLLCVAAMEAGAADRRLPGRTLPLLTLPPVFQCGSAIVDGREQIPEMLGPLTPFLPPRTGSLICVSFSCGSDQVGALYIAAEGQDPAFIAQDATLLVALAGPLALLLQNRSLQNWQRSAITRQQRLEAIRKELLQTLDLDVLIPRLFTAIAEELDVEAQSVWLVDEATERIHCAFASGPGAETVLNLSVEYGEGIVGATVERQETLVVPDARQDARHSRLADEATGLTTRSLLSVPMIRQGHSIGAIQALNKRSGLFHQEDRDLLRAIADIAVLAIENARLYAKLQASYDTTLVALTAALDARDHETEGHSRRVVEYAARLAREIAMPDEEIAVLRRGALLHDIGKLAVPDAILHKPGPLTPEEREVIKLHPHRGYEMLRGIPHLEREMEIVLTHQERWDGSGYPLGLIGEQIPLFARVFMLVDTLDAILSDRPYRRGQDYAVARQIIASESGRQFDPRLVDAFLAVPAEEWQIIRENVERTVSLPLSRPVEKV